MSPADSASPGRPAVGEEPPGDDSLMEVEGNAGASFVRRTERAFWLDRDGVNRWTPELTPEGTPRIEDRGTADERCAACQTEIRWLCYVRHPSEGVKPVGRCCIHKVIGALPPQQQAAYREAISTLDREGRNARRRAQGKPLIVGRKEKLRHQIHELERVSVAPELNGVTWLYNENRHVLRRDVIWYLSELRSGRRHSSFQTALKRILSEHGYPEVFD